MFFDFSIASNTIQPALLEDKLELAGVNQHLTSWILYYLTNRPQYVRIWDCVSDTVVCSTGAPQGTVLALSCSPCKPQTSTNNHATAICISSLTTLLSASSGTRMTEPTANSLRTLWTGASRTTSSSMPGGPKSWFT